jgi:hypothetical protein
VFPEQTGLLLPAGLGAAGVGFTVTVIVLGPPRQPLLFATTVYMVVTVGDATGLGEVVLFNPVAGDQT